MAKRLLALLLTLLLPCMALAEGNSDGAEIDAPSGTVIRQYDSETLRYTVERLDVAEARCYLTRVWMQSPGQQIRKATAKWKEDLLLPSEMGKKVKGAALVINGSGYVSPVFPWIPENYPGQSKDYHYTPLGSLTITNGEVFRNLPGVPYYGLTLEESGLQMYVGADNEAVLAASPTQTWSFYVGCPLIRDHRSILDTQWRFANARAARTIIAKIDEQNYTVLTVTTKTSGGLSLVDAVDYLLRELDPLWAYDLDGGPSSALLCRAKDSAILRTVYGNNSKDADIMAFVELPQAEKQE